MGAQQTTDNFWQVWQNFEWPEPQAVSYRCYYRDDGSPDFYTMEDLPGQWVEVTKEIYLLSPTHARVVDGELVILPPRVTVTKLQPSDQGVACDPRDVTIVVDTDRPHILWNKHDHETT